MFSTKFFINNKINEKLNIQNKKENEDFAEEVEYEINDMSYNNLINTNFKNIHDPNYSNN